MESSDKDNDSWWMVAYIKGQDPCLPPSGNRQLSDQVNKDWNRKRNPAPKLCQAEVRYVGMKGAYHTAPTFESERLRIKNESMGWGALLFVGVWSVLMFVIPSVI